MKRCLLLICALLLLTGCASVAREPDNLVLVRVLGVDGSGPVTLTAVCADDGQGNVARGSSAAADFGEARRQLPWSGAGDELSLTGVSYLLVGPDAPLKEVLLAVLEDVDLGATATVWLVENGAAAVLDACDDPAADLELLSLAGAAAPTVAQAAAALTGEGTVTLPCLSEQNGRMEVKGTTQWSGNN